MGEQIDMLPKVSLVAELMRLFDSSDSAMLCAMSHGQVRVSGHLVKPQHDMTWTEAQLAGRTANLLGREAQLFGGSRRATGETTQVVVNEDVPDGMVVGVRDGDE